MDLPSLPVAPRSRPFLIYGGGGFAREVAWLAETATEPRHVSCFVEDGADGESAPRNGIPVLSLEMAARRFPHAEFVAAVGDPSTRAAMARRAEEAGFVPASLVHAGVARSRWVEIGDGSVVCAGSILTTNIRLGRHVQINLDCTIGHDAVLEDFATLAPGVHVSGCVVLARGCYVGTGASIINGSPHAPLVVGAGATVGAGAVVTRSVPPNVTVVGVPARPRDPR